MKTALKYKGIVSFSVIIPVLFLLMLMPKEVLADEQELFASGSSFPSNVLIIFDNSQSMDQDFSGNLIGPYVTDSRLTEGKRALQTIVNNYVNSSRIGLMTFRLGAVQNYNVHNAVYFTSYEPKSYCPNPPPECVDYCKTDSATSQSVCQTSCVAQNASFDATYRDEIVTTGTGYAVGTEPRNRYCELIYPKTKSYVNPTDLTQNVYYKTPGTFYAPGNYGNAFCYSNGYNPSETVADYFQCYSQKLGTSDGSYAGANPGQYSTNVMNGTFFPTDEDIALGFYDFGRRQAWKHTGRTWFRNSSPGGGYLDVPIAPNDAFDTQKNLLLAKLDMKENDQASYMTCGTGNTCSYVVNAGLTPTAGTFQSAIDYFTGAGGYTSPIQDSCQKNFIVFVTDGLPSVSETGTIGTAAALMPAVLTKIQNLQTLTKSISGTSYTFNIPVYVIGMSITEGGKIHLESMASTGGTSKAYYATDQAALATALGIVFQDITNATYAFATSSIPSTRTTDENFLYESAFTPTPATDPFWNGFLKKWSLTSDGMLNTLVWEAGNVLKNTPAANRNMQTLIGGTLTNFTTNPRGDSGNLTYANLNVPNDGTATTVGTAYKVIQYVRGDSAYNPDDWKLGDIFHSNPVTIGTPNPFFYDFVQTTLTGNPAKTAFEHYRDNHPRVSNCSSCAGYGKRMIVTGANDGQFHVFNANDGSEVWSFIPPNLLPKLQYLYHASNPSGLAHNFFVDGPVTVADAWLPSTAGDGVTKYEADWKTMSIFSVGRNDRDYTSADKSAVPQSTKYWSSSPNCDTGLTEYYDNTSAKYYCGYYAFDVTNAPTSNPTFMWTLDPGAQLPRQYLGEPWSTVTVGRVRINGNERWVGFIGAGFDATSCTSCTDSQKRGKAVIVFDLKDGKILWNYRWYMNNTMGYAIPAPMAIVDTDNDGFIDKAFVGDIGGNMWQFKFCTKSAGSSCNTSNWKGSLLLARQPGGSNYPIYTKASITRDKENKLWVFWATGDKVDPANLSNPGSYVYGVMPCSDSSGDPVACSLSDLTAAGAYCASTNTNKKGWYMQLAAPEQALASPVPFAGYLFFTGFTPIAGTTSCAKTGSSKFYGITIDPGSGSYCNVGAGAFSGGATSIGIGVGIASQPIISIGPTGLNIHVSTSGAGGQSGATTKVVGSSGGGGGGSCGGGGACLPLSLPNNSNMIYWKDKKLE